MFQLLASSTQSRLFVVVHSDFLSFFFKSILQLELVRVEVLPHYQFNASDKLSDEMTQMQSMMHVIHSELHFCYANFSYAVQGHLSDVSLASPGHFLELMSALKKVEV